MRVDILGPVKVSDGDRELELGGPRNRALVARLALDPGRAVSVNALIDDLWGIDVPADAHNALQSIVSRTRRRLPDGALDRAASGYQLSIDRDDVDALRFERLLREGRAREALTLWRGEALSDLRSMPFAPAAAARLEELRMSALEDRIDDDLAQSRYDDAALIAELEDLTTAFPFRERLWGSLMRALVAADRQADALAAYERMRTELADAMGIDPSARLQELHLAILKGDPSLTPVRTASQSPPTNLRSALTSFVGREDALKELAELAREHRLVTLVGPGGAGKTRLASETARLLFDEHPDGVWLVELAPVTGESEIIDAMVGALGLREVVVLETGNRRPRSDDHARLLEALTNKRSLLVVDNCEHLIDGVAEVVDDLLAAAPGLRVITTSREPLSLTGEVVYQVRSLELPSADSPPADALGHSAVRLFVERARAASPGFVLDADNTPAVIEICRRLDGQPLAIELAAARLRALTATQIAGRLGDRFRLLTGGSRAALPRHRTLRAVVEWSWDLLTETERDLAERVAVFPAGVTPEGAAAVSPSLTPQTSLDVLTSLADKSLLVPVRVDDDAAPRFRMLETLREYGIERLVEQDLLESVRRVHLAYFLELVERLEPLLRGPEQIPALKALDRDRDNFIAALRFAIDRSDADSAMRTVAALGWYFSLRSQHEEAARWSRAAIDLEGPRSPSAELACVALALVTSFGIPERQDTVAGLAHRIEGLREQADAEHPLVALVLTAVDLFGATEVAELDLAAFDHPDPWTRAAARFMKVAWMENSGIRGQASGLLDEALQGFREVGDRWGLAMGLAQIGVTRDADGDAVGGQVALEEAISLLRELGAEDDAQQINTRLTLIRVREGRDGDRDRFWSELIAMRDSAVERGQIENELLAVMGLVDLARDARDYTKARELVLPVVERLGGHDAPGSSQVRALAEVALAMVQLALDDQSVAEATLLGASERARGVRDMPVVAGVAVGFAALARHRGDATLAAQRLGAADQIRGRVDRGNRDAATLAAELREVLGDSAYDEAYAVGLELERDAAIDLGAPTGIPTPQRHTE